MDETRYAIPTSATPPSDQDGSATDPTLETTPAPLTLKLLPGGLVVEVRQPNVLVGRNMQADVRVPFPDVSRRHCRLVFSENAWRIIDLQSLNGTIVNDQPVQEAVLKHGDVVRIGGCTFQVDLQPHSHRKAS
ncbi:MAG: hypothetical protein KatS3mg105_2313 [Gemmatales bacterium]|nr:MAG: hypothetical protein KatS3mg105_2313 [Gemmatales bacterium]